MEPMITHIDASNTQQLPKHPIKFTAEDLRTHLQPIIDKMNASEYSYHFRQPVDPVALNIRDYLTIIKHPMDISTIYNKLSRGEYENPLEFCDDVWLMFNNAWLYNKSTTNIYIICTKLAKLFVEFIDPVLQTLGYCCSCQYTYLPHVMLCYGNELNCQIPHGANYYYYNNPDSSRLNLFYDIYSFCCKCFDLITSDSILLGDNPSQPLIEIPKSLFSLAINNNTEKLERMIDCLVCTHRWHQVCALHFDQIWSEGFVCNTCIREYKIKRQENCYTAQQLPVTDLSLHLEKRVNDFLHNQNCHTGYVTIRILSASEKICKVKTQLKTYYPNEVINDYLYHMKVIFAFQEIDGVDVAFFGMYVQEYDEHCPAPNTRCVYIPYIDTVNFFQPKIYRTNVYHEILIGYLNYVKQHGYMYAHLWAHPATKDFDYIFYRHPSEQRMPTLKRMYDWCKKMLDKAIEEGIIINYKNIKQDCLDNQIQTVLEIPYFGGDLWPFMIEDNIEKFIQEKEEHRRKQVVEAIQSMEDLDLDHPIQSEYLTGISGKRKCANTYEKQQVKKMANNGSIDLLSAILSNMEKYKEAFFVIRLLDQIPSYPTVNDTNASIQGDLMNTRDVFINFAYANNYEFSSLRRAKFSTMAMLYELHTSTTEKCSYSCNRCRQQCDNICYYCTVCFDFDLCEKCCNIEPKHEHQMKCRISSITDVNQDDKHNSLNMNDISTARIQVQRQQSMQHCIKALNNLKVE